MLALIFTRKLRPMIIGSLSGWLMLAGMMARLARRRQDAARHAGHGDTDPAVAAQRSGDAFLELPGERLTFDGGESAEAQHLEAIDRIWRSA